MNKQNLIICENKILYNIFYEVIDYLNFEVSIVSKDQILDIATKNFDNYIVLTNQNILM